MLFNHNLTRNLFLLHKLVNRGTKVELTKDGIFIQNRNSKLLKLGTYDGKFWWLDFDLVHIADKPKILTKNEGRCEYIISGLITDYKYHRNEYLTHNNVNDDNFLQEYLESVSEMERKDLERLNTERFKALKENIRLLWNYRLGHVSKTYLDKAAKDT